MELVKAGIFVLATLLIYPYDECSGAYSSHPIDRILRFIQDNSHHQQHHQRSQPSDNHQDNRDENEHHQNDRHDNGYNQNDRHESDRHQGEYHQNDHHTNNHRDLRWSRPQEFEIIHANNDASPVLVLGEPARDQDNREVNDPAVLEMEAKPIETYYEIISAKEQKPRKVIISADDKKPAKGKKSPQRPKALVQENIAVNSLKYSKISKLNK